MVSIELEIASEYDNIRSAVPLLWDSVDDQPIYNVLIGPNGTFKSEILRSIALYFLNKKGRKQPVKVASFGRFQDIIPPNLIIAATNAVFDKFPRSETSFSRLKSSVLNKNKDGLKYYHFGAVANRRFFSARSMLYDSLASATNALVEGQSKEAIQAVFDFLGLDKQIDLVFSMSSDLKSYKIEKEIKGVEETDEIRIIQGILNSRLFKEQLLRFKVGNFSSEKYKFVVPLDFNTRRGVSKEVSEFLLGLEVLRRARLVNLEEARMQFSNGAPFELDSASSGQSSLLLMCLSIASVISENSLVIIDEPEIGLHPEWQNKFILLIDKILSTQRNVKVFIATHSPSLLTSLPSGRSNVIGLLRKNGGLDIDSVQKTPFGWAIDRILFDYFKLESARNHMVADKLKKMLKLIADPEIDTRRLKETIEFLEQIEFPMGDPILEIIENAKSIAGEK